METVYRNPNRFVIFNVLPSFCHAFRPINIIKNKDGIVICFRQKHFKILNGSDFIMVPIKLDAIIGWLTKIGYGFEKRTYLKGYIFNT